ncbi:MAG TPA: type II toxin-antitoxin system VapC family toxin [Candidatus Dormibacteraeota bacterium]|jgi:hypothetical protein|nr:type II toxin-antitoxin system VapC family toxin [Candidatus Dormibacteraeota bacterium]
MPDLAIPVLYWDSSAVLSVLVADVHSKQATKTIGRPGTHLISTLGYAEVLAVIARLVREGHLPGVIADATREVVRTGPWRRLALQPDWASIDGLSAGWPLRGADLWHLATVATLSRELPELRMMTFDARLTVAAEGLGLATIN